MSRIASDAVALAADGPRLFRYDDASQTYIGEPLATVAKFRPHRLFGLAARCLASSNAVYHEINYSADGSFSEPFTTKHHGGK